MNWNNITGFKFTYAIDGGACLRDGEGNVNWYTIDIINKRLGNGWFEKMRAKQGWMTGCWITV